MTSALIGAMEAVHAFAEQEALDIDICQRLAIIVEELVSNVLGHAAHERDITFRLLLEVGDEAPVVTLEDDSDPFDPRSVPDFDKPNEERGGGVGLVLVFAWAEILSYTSEGGWNRLVLLQRPVPG